MFLFIPFHFPESVAHSSRPLAAFFGLASSFAFLLACINVTRFLWFERLSISRGSLCVCVCVTVFFLLLFVSFHSFFVFVFSFERYFATRSSHLTLMYEKVLSCDQHNWNCTPFKIRIIAIKKGDKRRLNNQEATFDIFRKSFVWFVREKRAKECAPAQMHVRLLLAHTHTHTHKPKRMAVNHPFEKLIFQQLLLNM